MSNVIEAFLRWLTGTGANLATPRGWSEPDGLVPPDPAPPNDLAQVRDMSISVDDVRPASGADARPSLTAAPAAQAVDMDAASGPVVNATIEDEAGATERAAEGTAVAGAASSAEARREATVRRAVGAEAVGDDTADRERDPVPITAEPIEIRNETAGPPAAHEIKRRRELIRALFNDFWSDRLDKPAAFADRLNEAETYLNQRLEANGEAWRLDAGTRMLLGLPPRAAARSHAGRAH